jgi:hypothetical protein
MIDMTNKVFGRLKVLRRTVNTSAGRAQWLCICLCGKETIVLGKALRNGSAGEKKK